MRPGLHTPLQIVRGRCRRHRPRANSRLSRAALLSTGALLVVCALFGTPAVLMGQEDSDAARSEIERAWLEEIRGEEIEPRRESREAEGDAAEPSENGSEESSEADDEAEPVSEREDEAEAEPIQFRNPGEATPEQTNAEGDPFSPQLEEGPSFFSVLLRFVGMVAVLLGAFYLLMRFIRSRGGAPFAANNDLVQVIVSVPLVQGKFLQIVDIAGKLMVLGVSDSGVQRLGELEDGISADRVRVWQSRRSSVQAPAGLMDQLTRLIRGSEFRFWKNTEDKANDRASFREMLGDQVPQKQESDSEELGSLLREQKKKLAKLKSRKAEISLFDEDKSEE